MVERAFQIAEACIEDMSEYNRFLRKDFQECKIKMQPQDILENIFYFRICSYTEQIALINYLDKFLSEHKDVGIVVLCWVLSSFFFFFPRQYLSWDFFGKHCCQSPAQFIK